MLAMYGSTAPIATRYCSEPRIHVSMRSISACAHLGVEVIRPGNRFDAQARIVGRERRQLLHGPGECHVVRHLAFAERQ